MVLTTSGYSLVTPFPGASNSATGAAAGNTAASVSGAAFPTSIYVTGNRGISSFTPGNFTGNPNVGGAGATGSTVAASLTVQVGSGSDDASAPAPALSSRNIIANGTPNAVLVVIGTPTSGSSSSTVLPPGQTYRDTAPVPPAPPLGMTIPGSPSNPTGSTSGLPNPLNPLNSLFGGGQSRMPSIGVRTTGPGTTGGVSTSSSMFPSSN